MKTFNPDKSSVAINLITGLLGSGKTTFIQQLIDQQPSGERWGLLINDFGEIGIDAATLTNNHPSTPILEVTGGCLCCSAFQGYQQALTSLLSQQVDRILIEPSGLGHPAKILDLLRQSPFKKTVNVSSIIGIVTAKQLTPERWHKSAIMRDIVTLCDTLIINKTDLANQQDIALAKQVIANIYPAKEKKLFTQLTQRELATPSLIDFKQTQQPFYLLAGLAEHQQQTNSTCETFASQLPYCTQSKLQTGKTSSIGWLFDSNLQFHRTKLIAWLDKLGNQLLRAKGLVKTGNEWQHLNRIDDQTQLTDIAWRQDSRIELIWNGTLDSKQIESLEKELAEVVFIRSR